ncbi:cyclase family protein [Promethearchaeum syntrophicum]|uniref:Cyclase family protein n=1 Tax=Promethearchaeum syntrophicum TaxID=2594042 RepID=A0A5B9DDB1_9ARCH|nr:cyclase family protein [Candidatus Prometheoarchaeum syntrophicum]QEE16743.1 Kynurenine formamidase [Candidatus Prometheoarchaeum syntrophicum]
MKIYDISMAIDEKMLTYPGDPGFSFKFIKKNPPENWNLSFFSIGTHTGTHLDSSFHLFDDGKKIDQIDLNKCYGNASLLDLQEIPFGGSITEKDLLKFQIKKNDIILFKTRNSKTDYETFRDDYIYLSKDGAKYLYKIGIKAVGIDCLTIGPRETHVELLSKEILVYEGLDLRLVKPGKYIFSGFPIKVSLEGGLTRAVLIKE